MRQILCNECRQRPIHGGKGLREGTYEIYAASADGEPAEMARVMRGVAKKPTEQQRTMFVNSEPFPLATDFYNCEFCNGRIRPGQEAWTLTVWQPARQPEPEPWEGDYIEKA